MVKSQPTPEVPELRFQPRYDAPQYRPAKKLEAMALITQRSDLRERSRSARAE
jgi:hypothetical protein